MIEQLRYFLISMRPKQWIKNGIIFIPLIFSGSLTNLHLLYQASIAFFVFSFLACSLYVINDIVDRESDRKHTKKQHRPIAAWKLRSTFALIASLCLSVLSLWGAYVFFSAWVLSLFILYVCNTLIYVFFLKKIVFLDVLSIAFGFILRAGIWIYVIQVSFSWWLIIVVFIGATILWLLKRYQEIQLWVSSRTILWDYKKYPLKESIMFFSAILIVLYMVYTFRSVQPKIFIVTIPCIVFGVWRFLYSIFSLKKYSAGFEDIIFEDRYIIADIIVYILVVIGLIYLG